MRKKKSAEPEMGYCPFEHWLGRTRRLGAHGARALGAGTLGAQARQERVGRGAGRLGARGGCSQEACAHLGVLDGLCTWCTRIDFDPVSTQYCS